MMTFRVAGLFLAGLWKTHGMDCEVSISSGETFFGESFASQDSVWNPQIMVGIAKAVEGFLQHQGTPAAV